MYGVTCYRLCIEIVYLYTITAAMYVIGKHLVSPEKKHVQVDQNID